VIFRQFPSFHVLTSTPLSPITHVGWLLWTQIFVAGTPDGSSSMWGDKSEVSWVGRVDYGLGWGIPLFYILVLHVKLPSPGP
jgi:hypothetical protein